MQRRRFLESLGLAGVSIFSGRSLGASDASPSAKAENRFNARLGQDWLARWEKNILARAQTRYCDQETGEEIGWLISPFLNGFYYGYHATGNEQWVERLADWAGAWIARGVKEPDGFIGWPKTGTGGQLAKDFYTDSLLGEAMALRPVVLMADQVLKSSALKPKFGAQAEAWVKLAGDIYDKWIERGCWREVKDGGVWVVPAFGLEPQTGKWTEGYERRNTDGFSNPDNKQNHIARWLIAMHDVTGKAIFKEQAQKWWQVMRSRMKLRDGGKYFVWNYWEPAGPWDYNADGSPRHWIGVHANGGYYEIDLQGIVTAYDHGLVFTKEDLQRLVATNRDFMWNHQLTNAKFQRIDGGQPDSRWKDSPGMLWTALVPHDETLKKIFVANHNPASWGGIWATPWFLALERGK